MNVGTCIHHSVNIGHKQSVIDIVHLANQYPINSPLGLCTFIYIYIYHIHMLECNIREFHNNIATSNKYK